MKVLKIDCKLTQDLANMQEKTIKNADFLLFLTHSHPVFVFKPS
jgi:hypothetical protein